MASSGNFATWNGVEIPAYLSLSQGNTKVLGNTSTDASGINLNIGVTSGKWYVEFYVIITTSNYPYVGLSAGSTSQDFAASNQGYNGDIRYHTPNSTGMNNNTGSAGIINRWGTISTTETGVDACSSGDIVGFALDMDNKKLFISRNGTFFNSGDPANGTNPQASWTTNPESAFINCFTYTSSRGCVVNAGQDSSFSNNKTSGSANATDGNGFGDFYYTPPTGFLALCSANLPTSTDIDPAETDDDFPQKQFNCVTYTGNASTRNITGVGFQPDLVITRGRSDASVCKVVDSSRGATKVLQTHSTSSESTDSSGLTAFGSDGYTLGSDAGYNNNSTTYVAWCWRANGGTTASNSDGDITSTVQANTKAGFSIVTYTGDNTDHTGVGYGSADIGHGLSKAPELVISKRRDGTGGWYTYHVGAGIGYVQLDSNITFQAGGVPFGPNAPTTTTVGAYSANNNSGHTYLYYCWHSVDGYSKFGSYEGNGNDNGPFIYTGFRPRYFWLKEIDVADDWVIYDTARDTANTGSSKVVRFEASGTEYDHSSRAVDIYSNGFKLRTSNNTINASNSTYIYAAWGDVPFKYNNSF